MSAEEGVKAYVRGEQLAIIRAIALRGCTVKNKTRQGCCIITPYAESSSESGSGQLHTI